jgi:hypothetical protein
MKHTICTLLLAALAASSLGAQSVAENRAYFRLGGAYHLNDMKAYLGDRTFSPVYEFGYDFKGPTETTGFGLYVSYITGHGDLIAKYRDVRTEFDSTGVDTNYWDPDWDDDDLPVPHYLNDGLKQWLFGWRIGGDLRYRTPVQGLTLFMGFSANWWDGRRVTNGRAQDPDDYEHWYPLPAGNWPEGKAKIGWRFGAEYRINKNWGVCWDTSVSSWMSRNGSGPGQETTTGTYSFKGVNPVNPSWMNFAVQYRWNIWN